MKIDHRALRGGEKLWSWVKKGVPLLIEVGPRDIAAGTVSVIRRDVGPQGRANWSRNMLVGELPGLLDEIQESLFARAVRFREEHTVQLETRDEFYEFFTAQNPKKPEIHGGFAWAHWSGDPAVEEQINRDLKVTIRCLPLTGEKDPGRCVVSGAPSDQRVLFAKSY